ncbi:MAG: hypothetical protein ABIP75_00245, partial [Pyrinomonadaceae bacterium]
MVNPYRSNSTTRYLAGCIGAIVILAAVVFVIFRVIRPFLRGDANQPQVKGNERTKDPGGLGDTV